MGDGVAQRGVSDAESVGGDELREPRRRNSPSDPTSREMGDMQIVGYGVQLVRAWSSRGTPRGRPQRA